MQTPSSLRRVSWSTFIGFSLVLVCGCALWFKTAAAAVAATITVNSTADNVANDGNCSLREAITAANTNTASGAAAGECAAGMAGLDNIVFNLGADTPTIVPTSALPTITEPVNLNGNTGGATRVELNGLGAGTADGLLITAGNSTIQGLVINQFAGDGIEIQIAGGNVIKNCYIGTDATGTLDLGNNDDGVGIYNAVNNTVGGTTAGERNLISGNSTWGVTIGGAMASGNKVSSNYIGTDVSGTVDLGNTHNGVLIFNAPNNTIGGTTAAERNVISGNDEVGVDIGDVTASGNKVSGNYIGTDVNGTADLGNSDVGVFIFNAPNNIDWRDDRRRAQCHFRQCRCRHVHLRRSGERERHPRQFHL
jgi:CSLREA domain-containing protein